MTMGSFQIVDMKVFSGWRTSVGSKRHTRVDSVLEKLFSLRDQDFYPRKGNEVLYEESDYLSADVEMSASARSEKFTSTSEFV